MIPESHDRQSRITGIIQRGVEMLLGVCIWRAVNCTGIVSEPLVKHCYSCLWMYTFRRMFPGHWGLWRWSGMRDFLSSLLLQQCRATSMSSAGVELQISTCLNQREHNVCQQGMGGLGSSAALESCWLHVTPCNRICLSSSQCFYWTTSNLKYTCHATWVYWILMYS